MIEIPIGLLYSNAAEWFIHKHVLHGRGRNKESTWSFHWHEHHREARLNGFADEHYRRSIFGWHAQSKEALGVAGLALMHLPLLPVAPFFTATLVYSASNYYRMHKRSHEDPEWAREHLPWHYDHHMGRNQDANWCVTKPWFDVIMNTREPYIGTQEERNDLARAEKRVRSRAAQEAEKEAA